MKNQIIAQLLENHRFPGTHTYETIAAALLAGEPVWMIDTVGRGDDDIVIAPESALPGIITDWYPDAPEDALSDITAARVQIVDDEIDYGNYQSIF